MRSMAMRSMAALAVAVCTATSVPAHASETTQHTQSRPDAKPASESARWYGWQIAIFDAAALALAIAGSSTDSDPLFYSGIGVYLVVPPAIHAVQDEGGALAASLALRALLPAVVALGTAPTATKTGAATATAMATANEN